MNSNPGYIPLNERLAHKCFQQPDSHKSKVWRYMNLAKLISLISEKRLYLTRLDKLIDDPHEGTLSKYTINGIKSFAISQNWDDKPVLDQLMKHYHKNRATTYVCCWHMNEQESEAMWRLYCGINNGHGVAIQTTYSHLLKAIETESDVYIGCVRYFDPTSEPQDINALCAAMYKRNAFIHEKEIRMVISPGELRKTDNIEHSPESWLIPWDSAQLIEQIYIDPCSPDYIAKAIKTVINAIAPELSKKIKDSHLKEAPFFP
ncbi:hypothetical protein [Nitrosomonas sp.]|uniref:hypothetical protein n=1 Tax=Nitrosomonas sp. TaxID=42353 RepID=UPI00260412DD|nr:hypothetical protein [Nitrosomonas sp.]MCW5602610.1 DUF2971 domain-containing protein [Nitrosomonas sp.]